MVQGFLQKRTKPLNTNNSETLVSRNAAAFHNRSAAINITKINAEYKIADNFDLFGQFCSCNLSVIHGKILTENEHRGVNYKLTEIFKSKFMVCDEWRLL